MNNEPVAWKYKVNKNNTKTEGICTDKHYLEKDGIYDIEPLYTHPAKTLTEIIEKNKPEIEKVNAYIKSLEDEIEALKAKTLTDDEILEIAQPMFEAPRYPSTALDFARAILKKASEK